MKLSRQTKRKSLLERQLAVIGQIHEIQRELTNMKRQGQVVKL